MATSKQRKRKHRQRAHHATQPRLSDVFRAGLDPNAPTALGLREMWVTPEALGLRDEFHGVVLAGLPVISYVESGEPLAGEVDAAEAWDHLEAIHDVLTGRVADLVHDRGSAEFLWWLRRLGGQFDDVNSMGSTGPYLQALAEVLSAGRDRPSRPLPHEPTFTFGLDEGTLLDLVWLREVSIVIYQLHATMKRCAKGQTVEFIPGAVPRWVPDNDLDDAIEDYDTRAQRDNTNLLQAVGVAEPTEPDMQSGELRVGGLVPAWFTTGVAKPPPFEKADALPAILQWVDLDAVTPLRDQTLLTEAHVALIALLWATFGIATHEPEHLRRRMTTPIQWGYMVTPTEQHLIPALEEVVEEIATKPGLAIAGCWQPGSAAEVLAVLADLEPEYWPPLVGNPVHSADAWSLIDLVGATRRLFTTLERPADGTDVNIWSYHFEQNVQAAVDATPWKPEGSLRDLIGRSVKNPAGAMLTDIDAVGFNDGRLLLISCKSIAFTVPALRGEFAVTRNIVDKVHKAAAEWDSVTKLLNDNTGLLNCPAAAKASVEGVVAFPSVPFFTDVQWRRQTFESIPYLLSFHELRRALSV